MTKTLTFQEYIENELEIEDNKNKEYEFDDYSLSSNELEYTTQE